LVKRLSIILPLLFIAVGIIPRLLPHAPNVAPITAMALFGAAYLNRRYALIFPLLAMLVGDAIIGFYTPGTMAAVYASFLISGVIGFWIRRQKSLRRIAAGTLAASIQFFVLTNFAGWLFGHGSLYPQTWAGLTQTYDAAIPFFRNTLFGDLLYVTALFGLYEAVMLWLRKRNAKLQGLSTV
jgi:hypothetical protein